MRDAMSDFFTKTAILPEKSLSRDASNVAAFIEDMNSMFKDNGCPVYLAPLWYKQDNANPDITWAELGVDSNLDIYPDHKYLLYYLHTTPYVYARRNVNLTNIHKRMFSQGITVFFSSLDGKGLVKESPISALKPENRAGLAAYCIEPSDALRMGVEKPTKNDLLKFSYIFSLFSMYQHKDLTSLPIWHFDSRGRCTTIKVSHKDLDYWLLENTKSVEITENHLEEWDI